MNIQSIILLIAIVLLFVYVVYGLIKNRKQGGPCSGCSNAGVCGGSCDRINSKDK